MLEGGLDIGIPGKFTIGVSYSNEKTDEEENAMAETREFFDSDETEMQVGRATCYSEHMTIYHNIQPLFSKNFINGKKLNKLIIRRTSYVQITS